MSGTFCAGDNPISPRSVRHALTISFSSAIRAFALASTRSKCACGNGCSELDVPVAVLVPHELVERLGREIEPVRVEVLDDVVLRLLQPADQPPVDERVAVRQ